MLVHYNPSSPKTSRLRQGVVMGDLWRPLGALVLLGVLATYLYWEAPGSEEEG